MPIKFSPNYAITPKIASSLMRIGALKEQATHLPLTPMVLATLRETARLYSTHYSTMIEGNRLTCEQVEEVLKHKGHFPGRERDEKEVKGYYVAHQSARLLLLYIHKIAPKLFVVLDQVCVRYVLDPALLETAPPRAAVLLFQMR